MKALESLFLVNDELLDLLQFIVNSKTPVCACTNRAKVNTKNTYKICYGFVVSCVNYTAFVSFISRTLDDPFLMTLYF